MSMHLEAFMPCLGEVDACCELKEINVPPDCCGNPNSTNTPRILTKDADLQVCFDINYNGPLFSILPTTCDWKCEIWFENVGGLPDSNFQKQVLHSHVPATGPHTLSPTVTVPWNCGIPCAAYRPICKITLECNGIVLVTAFSEGDIILFGS